MNTDRRLEALRRTIQREQRLAERGRRNATVGPWSGERARIVSALVRVAAACLSVVAPFAVLVRGAVELGKRGVPPWAAVGGGALLAGIVILGIAAVITRRLTGRARVSFAAKWVAMPLVLGWTLYGVLFLSAVNAKGPGVQGEFRALHPTLRLAVSTVVLTDAELVVTDLSRRPEDYERMGLPAREGSHHFRQADGWVHAADVRTVGRREWRTAMTTWAFRILGFNVFRHRGTEDHLHVSTPFDVGSSQVQ